MRCSCGLPWNTAPLLFFYFFFSGYFIFWFSFFSEASSRSMHSWELRIPVINCMWLADCRGTCLKFTDWYRWQGVDANTWISWYSFIRWTSGFNIQMLWVVFFLFPLFLIANIQNAKYICQHYIILTSPSKMLKWQYSTISSRLETDCAHKHGTVASITSWGRKHKLDVWTVRKSCTFLYCSSARTHNQCELPPLFTYGLIWTFWGTVVLGE